MRAASKNHVKYEIYKRLLESIELDDLRDEMVSDKHSEKRFIDGLTDIKKDLEKKLSGWLKERLPKGHPDKEDSV